MRIISGSSGGSTDAIEQEISELAARAYKKKIGAAACFGWLYATTTLSAVDGGKTFITTHRSTDTVTNMQLVYGNFISIASSNVDPANANDIVVKCAVSVGGTIMPLYFNGQRSITITAGGIVKTDPIGITIPANEDFLVRTFIAGTAGEVWPKGYAANAWAAGDVADSGSSTTAHVDAYSPLCILGNTSAPSIAVVGDSISNGSGDASTFSLGGRTVRNTGFVMRAFGNVKNFVNVSVPSEYVTSYNYSYKKYRRGLLIYPCKYAIVELGINNIISGTSLASMQAAYTALWTKLSDDGLLVYQTTLTPYTTSTDSWATVENQTVSANEATRVALNDWFRTTPSPLTGYIENADVVESARNSGKWKASNTGDGIHPNTTGQPAIAAAIDTTTFV